MSIIMFQVGMVYFVIAETDKGRMYSYFVDYEFDSPPGEEEIEISPEFVSTWFDSMRETKGVSLVYSVEGITVGQILDDHVRDIWNTWRLICES